MFLKKLNEWDRWQGFRLKNRFFLKVIFILYLVFLVWLVIFKFNISINDIHKVREVNLIPFHYENVIEGDFPLMEALFNFIVFIPFGLLQYVLVTNKGVGSWTGNSPFITIENRRSNDYKKAVAIYAENGVSRQVWGKTLLPCSANSGKKCILSAKINVTFWGWKVTTGNKYLPLW